MSHKRNNKLQSWKSEWFLEVLTNARTTARKATEQIEPKSIKRKNTFNVMTIRLLNFKWLQDKICDK